MNKSLSLALGLALSCTGVYAQRRPVTIIKNPGVIQGPPPTKIVKLPSGPIHFVVDGNIPPMMLKAATAINNGRPEVRLRWLVTEGWIPEGRGFNVYKIVNGVKTGPLNPSPIASDETKFASHAVRFVGSSVRGGTRIPITKGPALSTGPSKQDILLKAFQTARTVPTNIDRKTLFSFKPLNRQITLAAPTFTALKSHIQEYKGSRPQLALPANQLLQNMVEAPDVKGYATKLGLTIEARANFMQRSFPSLNRANTGPATGPITRPGGVRLNTGAQMTGQSMGQNKMLLPTTSAPPQMHTMMSTNYAPIQDARTMLAIGAMTSPSIADGLGLAFTDTQVQQGQQIQYVLEFLPPRSGVADVATADITVGSDPALTAPDGLDGFQIGVNRVWLYWKPATDAQRDAAVVPSYHIVRIDPQNPQGVDVAGAPVLKSTQAAADNPNEQVEPLASFEDSNAPVGQCTYKVSSTDAFGRESVAATVAVTVQDWATPAPVGKIKVQLDANKLPQVLWSASTDAEAKYRVYRVDPNQMARLGANYKPELVSGDMIPGVQVLAQMEGRPFEGLVAQRGKIIQRPQTTTNGGVGRISPGLLGLENYQSFVDTTAPRDNYFRYIVTAVYPRNGRDSEPRLSERIGVPTLTPPPAVTQLAGTFELLPRKRFRGAINMGRLYNRPAIPLLVNGPQLAPGVKVERIKTYQPHQGGRVVPVRGKVTNQLGRDKVGVINLVNNLPTPDYASNAVLTWNPVPGPGAPFTYRVYRYPVEQPSKVYIKLNKSVPISTQIKYLGGLNVSGLTGHSTSIAGPITNTGVAGPSSIRKAGGVKIAPQTTTPVHAQTKAVNLQGGGFSSMASAKMRDAAIRLVLPTPPTLAGETVQTTLRDGHLASAVGQDFDYVVIPKNQWGIEGEPATIRVHMKPTMEPSVPRLMSAEPNPNQPDQALLTVLPNPEAEEVTSYIVERKELPAPPKSRPNNIRLNTSVRNAAMKGVQQPSTTTRNVRVKALNPAPAPTTTITTGGQLSTKAYLTPNEMAALLESIYSVIPSTSILMSLDQGIVSLVDTSTTQDKHYSYRVIAVNSAGLQSGESGYLETSTRPASLPKPVIGTPQVSADGVTIPLVGSVQGLLVLERAQTINGTDTDFIQILGPVAAPLIDRSAMQGQTYKYRVRVFGSGVSSPASDPVTVAYNP